MNLFYVTITGLQFRYGSDFLEPNMRIKLTKEPDNEFDTEVIKAELPGLGTIGYVANSPKTVLGECYSAGRLYDKIPDSIYAEVCYVTGRGIVCSVDVLQPKPAKIRVKRESVLRF